MQVVLDGALAQPERRRDVGDREVVEVVQCDDGALLGTQSGDRGRQFAVVERGGVRPLELGGPRCVGAAGETPQGHGAGGATTLLVDGPVDRHAPDPPCGVVEPAHPAPAHVGALERVGHAVGARDAQRVRDAGAVGLQLTLAAQVLSAGAMLLLPRAIARLYTHDEAVVAIAVQLLMLAGLFQFSDGIQCAANGALRGLKDTRVPMAITLFAVNKGAFDDVDVKRALACETAMHQFVKTKAADLVAKIESTKALDAEGEKQLAAAIEEFKKSWA